MEDPPRRGADRDRRGEVRAPYAVATVVAAAAYAALPDDLLLAPRFAVPAVEALLLVALLVVNPWRMDRETVWSRRAALALVAVIAATNLAALGLTVTALVRGTPAASDSGTLLTAALQIWVTGVLAFALAYAQLDRGGPVSRRRRRRDDLPPADWRFSQDEDHDAVREVARGSSVEADWVPSFPDYLYLSLTNSSAFSPADTMPLTTRAKVLMGIQASAALLTTLVVISAAVGQLGG
ncbi:hypothetical protein [Klenkia brasiliensis]|uniref:DUF1345 domain-containing protein n=1 Tax=Klenkia brasiliensis TaxID=333142 RepID=A0A1G7YS68_9ACTN|nr:hypothetical protein [Klenkia brasiliensis]SDG99301.1 hypothetical protein SAMN05660324_4069 [Klenkia brasiliensis]